MKVVELKDLAACPFCKAPFTETETAVDHCCIGLIAASAEGGVRYGVRALVIDPGVVARAKEVIEYAEAHPYTLAEGDVHLRDADGKIVIPGDLREHCCYVPIGIAAVFSISISPADGGTFRHLSISLIKPKADRVIAPEIAFGVAHALFGFKGPPTNWSISPPSERPPHACGIAQLIDPGPFAKPIDVNKEIDEALQLDTEMKGEG